MEFLEALDNLVTFSRTIAGKSKAAYVIKLRDYKICVDELKRIQGKKKETNAKVISHISAFKNILASMQDILHDYDYDDYWLRQSPLSRNFVIYHVSDKGKVDSIAFYIRAIYRKAYNYMNKAKFMLRLFTVFKVIADDETDLQIITRIISRYKSKIGIITTDLEEDNGSDVDLQSESDEDEKISGMFDKFLQPERINGIFNAAGEKLKQVAEGAEGYEAGEIEDEEGEEKVDE